MTFGSNLLCDNTAPMGSLSWIIPKYILKTQTGIIPHSVFVSMNGLLIYLGNRHLFRETSPVITLNSIMKETKSSLPRQLY